MVYPKRNELVSTLVEMGFELEATASSKWKYALYIRNGAKSLYVLVRARGVDMLETPLDIEDMTHPDGSLSISKHREGDRFAEYFYSESKTPIHDQVLAVASQFKNGIYVDQNQFNKIGIGRSEQIKNYKKQIGDESLRALYVDMMIEEGEDVYLSDGVWLSSDGSMHDRGR
jgi:hypothetical protein